MPRVKTEFRQVSKENYIAFTKLHPEVAITFDQFKKIIYTFNYCFRDYILRTGDLIKYPFGHGDFSINKKKTRRKNVVAGKEYIILPVNWKKTNELKKVNPDAKRVYIFNSHTNGYRFKWHWVKKAARFQHAEIYNFKPFRTSSRLITEYVTKPDSPYIDLYKQYDTR